MSRAVRVGSRRLACKKGEYVTDDGSCRGIPAGTDGKKLVQWMQRRDAAIERYIWSSMADVKARHARALRDLDRYQRRINSIAHATRIVESLKTFDRELRTYVGMLLRCREDQEVHSREHLEHCLNRPKLMREVDVVRVRALDALASFDREMASLKTWKKAAVSLGKKALTAAWTVSKRTTEFFRAQWYVYLVSYASLTAAFGPLTRSIGAILAGTTRANTALQLGLDVFRALLNEFCADIFSYGAGAVLSYVLAFAVIESLDMLFQQAKNMLKSTVGLVKAVGTSLMELLQKIDKAVQKHKSDVGQVLAVIAFMLWSPLTSALRSVASLFCSAGSGVQNFLVDISRKDMTAAQKRALESDDTNLKKRQWLRGNKDVVSLEERIDYANVQAVRNALGVVEKIAVFLQTGDVVQPEHLQPLDAKWMKQTVFVKGVRVGDSVFTTAANAYNRFVSSTPMMSAALAYVVAGFVAAEHLGQGFGTKKTVTDYVLSHAKTKDELENIRLLVIHRNRPLTWQEERDHLSPKQRSPRKHFPAGGAARRRSRQSKKKAGVKTLHFHK